MEQKLQYRGFEIEIVDDEDGPNPRTDWDNLGTMYAKGHRRYDLGDKDCDGMDTDMFSGWKETREYIKKKLDAAVILPLMLYDHSGITMYIPGDGGYRQHEAWDSGQVGYIYVSRKKIREEYGCKRVSSKFLKRAEEVLRSEVKYYDMYLRGECYGYQIKDVDGDTLESCFGYLGDPEESGCITDAKDAVNGIIRHKIKDHLLQVKEWIRNKVPHIYRTPLQLA